MRSATGRLFFALALCLLAVCMPSVALAHPAGFASVNRYIGVVCESPTRLRIAYLIDFAELPSYAEIDRLDKDQDGTVSAEEQRAYLDERVPPLVASWTVEIDGARASTRVTASSLEIRSGERGMSTVRIAAEVSVESTQPGNGTGGEVHVHVRDTAFSDRSGWREMAADDSATAVVTEGSKGAQTEALAYQKGRTDPPRVDDARFTFRMQANDHAEEAPPRGAPPASVDPRLAQLSSMLRRASGSWLFSLAALGLALALGAIHALSPGHGKALAAAYLVGGRARRSHAVVFGATVTLAHTAVVFVVGCFAIALERTVGSDRLMRGLELAAAITVMLLGATQLSRRWRELSAHDGGHAHPLAEIDGAGLKPVVALGVSSGIAPCPSALAVLLAAVALHRYGFGLVLVLAFSIGVACTLTAVGLLVVVGRQWLSRAGAGRAEGGAWGRTFLRWLPILSSACVLVIGVLLCASASTPW